MPKYAERTEVSSEKSRAEIERTISRYGASQFAYAWEEGRAVIAFRIYGRHIRFLLPLPGLEDEEFKWTPSRQWRREPKQQREAWEQACRQRWRALALVLKAKLEAVEAGIVEFDREFLPFVVLPSGQTVGDWVSPQVEEVYATGQMPSLLPGVLALPAGSPNGAER